MWWSYWEGCSAWREMVKVLAGWNTDSINGRGKRNKGRVIGTGSARLFTAFQFLSHWPPRLILPQTVRNNLEVNDDGEKQTRRQWLTASKQSRRKKKIKQKTMTGEWGNTPDDRMTQGGWTVSLIKARFTLHDTRPNCGHTMKADIKDVQRLHFLFSEPIIWIEWK